MTETPVSLGEVTILSVPDFAHGSLDRPDSRFIDACGFLADSLTTKLAIVAPERLVGELGSQADIILTHAFHSGIFQPEVMQAMLEGVVPKHGGPAVVLPDSAWGADLARRLSVTWDVSPITRVVQVLDGSCVCLFGEGHETVQPLARVVTLSADFHPGQGGRPRNPVAHRLPELQVECAIKDLGKQLAENALLEPLENASFIVAGGDGIQDWQAFQEMALQLGATLGGSRVVCDRGILPRHRQVGSSGTLVDARVYLAMGISGAIQHLDGIESCETVISVNTDSKATIHQRAEIAICADANDVAMEILAALARDR